MFCSIELAARIERAEAELMAACCGFARPVAGGFATFAEPGSPYNKVAGLGFDGPADLELVERDFAERGAPVQVELSQLADPSLTTQLLDRGYRLEGFENVLGRALDELPDPVPGIEIRRDHDLESWLALVCDAFSEGDDEGLPSHEEFSREAVARALRQMFSGAGAVRYGALRDGVLAGGGSMRISGGVAQLTGAATAPEHRRRGVQSALLAARLRDAAGCEVATVTTSPASKSQENAQRQGFALLYTRAIWVKPG